MRRAVLAVFAGVLMVSPAPAMADGPLAWQGYRRTADIDLPFAAIARRAVVEIYTVGSGDEPGEAREVAVTADQPVITDQGLLDSDFRVAQIETCRRQSLAQCPISHVVHAASGVMIEPDQMYTCRHVVNDWPLSAARLNVRPLASISPAMIVYDQDHKVIYNSAYSGQAKYSLLDDDPRLLAYNDQIEGATNLSFLRLLADVAALQFPEKLGTAALAINTAVEPGQPVIFSGYPVRTRIFHSRDRDAPGLTLVSSVGPLGFADHATQIFFADGLSDPGMSGGLVSHPDGSVVGITCSANAEGMNSTGHLLDIERLKAAWQHTAGLGLDALPIEDYRQEAITAAKLHMQ